MQQENDRAGDEALHWLIALHDEEDDKELRARFDLWLDAGSGNRRAWHECQHVWNTLGAIEGMTEARPSRAAAAPGLEALTPPPAPRQRFVSRTKIAAGVTALFVICLAVVTQPFLQVWLTADYSTSVAQTRQIRLADGSVVFLGADSAISVSYEAESRNVDLLAGEAYFDVVPDPARPFNVETGSFETRVLGTGFNVRRSAAGINVAVNNGRVVVLKDGLPDDLAAPLVAGDWANVTWDGKVERGKDTPEMSGGWRSGLLVVKDRAVGDVIDDIRRHYKGKILTIGTDFSDLRVTGVYDLRRPIEALNAVVQVHGSSVHEVSPWVTVVSRW